MSKAVRGSGETDDKTRQLLKDLEDARKKLVDHVLRASTQRNTSKQVARRLAMDVAASGIDMGNVGAAAADIQEWRDRQDTAAPGKTAAGHLVRRKARTRD